MPALSPTHLAAIARRRRLIVNFDVTFAINVQHRRNPDRPDLVEHLFEFADAPESQIDSIWWNWGEGNQVPYPSEHLPLYDHPLYQKWADEGTDIVGQVLAATQRRGLECFFSHRMNGSDNDLGPFARIPAKVAHPDWLFRTPWCTHEDNGYWNFALPQVHDYVLRNLREVIERWPFDGMELDFARGVVFPAGQGWSNRERLTEFIAQLRELSLAVSERRGRPFLLAARIPETLVGCRFDGIDVEHWVDEQLIDLLALGVRSFEVDLADFRRVVAGTPVKLYPSIDDHHATDGYQNPGIEVLRGVAANWWHQGADGIHTFNFNYATDAPYAGQDWASHRRAYQELGAVATLSAKDKCFVVQRRGGGHGSTVIPNPEDWATPRYNYANTNMLAQLPAAVPNDGRTDLLLQIDVGLDLAAERIATARVAPPAVRSKRSGLARGSTPVAGASSDHRPSRRGTRQYPGSARGGTNRADTVEQCVTGAADCGRWLVGLVGGGAALGGGRESGRHQCPRMGTRRAATRRRKAGNSRGVRGCGLGVRRLST